MATGVSRKVSAASARSHTRRAKKTTSFQLPSGILRTTLAVLFIGFLAWAYQAIRPPPPKICGTPDGPPVTAARIKLRDGRHLAYREHGVPKETAKHKIIFSHGFSGSSHTSPIAETLSPDVVQDLGIYIVSFDRPGYGESDPDPNRTPKSIAFDVEELADKLGLGSKFYVTGLSMGGQTVWSCLKYIPHRLAGAALLTPGVNYWWHGLPANLTSEAYYQQRLRDQWALRVAHYTPWLTYWWNTQKWFPVWSAIGDIPSLLSQQDKLLLSKIPSKRESYLGYAIQQGEFESLHQDLNIGIGSWEYSPLDLENPFPTYEGSVHLWQGDEDLMVPVTLQRYIAQKLPWIHYHELPGSGHLFFRINGMSDTIIKSLLGVK